MPKINAFKQYYARNQDLVYFRACIPPPNSSPSFEVSAIFPPVKLMTFLSMEILISMQSRKLVYYCLWLCLYKLWAAEATMFSVVPISVPLFRCPVPTSTRPQGGRVRYTQRRRHHMTARDLWLSSFVLTMFVTTAALRENITIALAICQTRRATDVGLYY